jgi:hypothetical protein
VRRSSPCLSLRHLQARRAGNPAARIGARCQGWYDQPCSHRPSSTAERGKSYKGTLSQSWHLPQPCFDLKGDAVEPPPTAPAPTHPPGVRGRVTSADTGTPLAATLTVETTNGAGDPVPFYASSSFGFYARPLAPGTYTLTAAMTGYTPVSSAVTVPAGGTGVTRDFVLIPMV